MRRSKIKNMRDAMRASRNTKPYESRASIRRKNAVNQRVNQFVSGLGQIDDQFDDSVATQKIIDEYYQPEEMPSSDALTEMMGWEESKIKYIVAGLGVIAITVFLASQ